MHKIKDGIPKNRQKMKDDSKFLLLKLRQGAAHFKHHLNIYSFHKLTMLGIKQDNVIALVNYFNTFSGRLMPTISTDS